MYFLVRRCFCLYQTLMDNGRNHTKIFGRSRRITFTCNHSSVRVCYTLACLLGIKHRGTFSTAMCPLTINVGRWEETYNEFWMLSYVVVRKNNLFSPTLPSSDIFSNWWYIGFATKSIAGPDLGAMPGCVTLRKPLARIGSLFGAFHVCSAIEVISTGSSFFSHAEVFRKCAEPFLRKLKFQRNFSGFSDRW